MDLIQAQGLPLQTLALIQQQFAQIEKTDAQQLDFSTAVRALEQQTALQLSD